MPKRDSIGKYETIQMANTARHTINAEVYTSPVEKATVGFGVTAAMGRTGLQLCPSGQFLYGAPVCPLPGNGQCVPLHVRLENLFDQKFMTNDYNFGPRESQWIRESSAV